MKRILSVLFICVMVLLLVACEIKDKEKTDSKLDNGVTKTDVEGVLQYKEPNFMKDAGFEVVKSDSLSDLAYDTILLTDNSTAQLDFAFSDGRLATLLIKKTEDYLNEKEFENIKVGDFEVKKRTEIDNITHYYWTKEYTFYVLSIPADTELSDADLQRIIEGFSINVGDNY